MDATAAYDFSAYDTMATFTEAQRSLEKHKQILAELGEVIVKYKLEKIVGVSLLHKHFKLLPDRPMVRRLRNEEITSSSEPYSVDLVPSNWRLLHLGNKIAFVPVEFIHVGSFSPDVVNQSAILQANTLFLDEFAKVLRNNNVADVFGISTRNLLTQLDVDSTIRIVSEVSDNDLLTSRFRIDPRPLLEEPEGAALWSFSRGKDRLEIRADYSCSACNSPK
jgi:hypothetical protein